MKDKFKIQFLDDALDFIHELDEKSRYKIIYNINKAKTSKDPELFKKVFGEIWEFRTLFMKKYYRLFAFWDKTDSIETIVISTHGLIKKTDKVPPSEIEKAERLRKKYFESKNIKS